MKILAFTSGVGFLAVCSVFAPASAQAPPPTSAIASPQPNGGTVAPKMRGPYYVDFRARTAASYGHAFVWYGRVGIRAVEVAGLHPSSDNVIPYLVGHLLPVPAETGASYGDLDDQYLTASYRVYLSEPEAKKVFAYIKRLQASSPVWNAALYNCVAFISDIARHMGLKTPASHLLYPEDWVNELRALNTRVTPAKPRSASAPKPGSASRPAQGNATMANTLPSLHSAN
jgi:hypothetical protein